MTAAAVTITLSFAVPGADNSLTRVLDEHHGMVETGGYNRGSFIDRANKKYAYLKAPYCASGLSLSLDDAGIVHPRTRSARARAFVNPGCVIDARDVWKGNKTVRPMSVAVFIRKGGGHVEVAIEQRGDSLLVFGYNTSPPAGMGSQFDGQWSGYKWRSIRKDCSPLNAFRITHFVEIHGYKVYTDHRGNSIPSGQPNGIPAQGVPGY